MNINSQNTTHTYFETAKRNLRALNQQCSEFLADTSLILSKSLDFETNLNHLIEFAIPKIADWMAVYIKDEEYGVLKLATFYNRTFTFGKSEKLSLAPLLPLSELQSTYCSELPSLFITQSTEREHAKAPVALVPLVSHGRNFGVMVFSNPNLALFSHTKRVCMIESLAQRISMAYENARSHKQLENSIKIRDEFLAIASHELKTPLTPLKLQFQMLIKAMKQMKQFETPSDKLDKILRSSDKQLDKINSLIDELLDVARINSGNLQLQIIEFDLVHLAKEIIDRYNHHLSTIQCQLNFESSESCILVEWDIFRIEQVIVNLLTNAIKYGAEKPINISIKRNGNQVTVSIKDYGIGISQKDQERIFNRFERAVTSNYFNGLGLGLFISNQIIQAHQGHIEVISSIGEGATFSFHLPIQIDLPIQTRANKPCAVNPLIS